MSEAQGHLRAADAALQAGRRPEAEAAIRAAIAAAPDTAQVQHLGGMLLLRLGHLAEALPPLARAAAAEDAPTAWVVAHGNAEAMAGRGDAAEAAFRRVLAREPGHAVALLNLGILLTGRGALGEAQPLLEQALAARPGHAPTLLALGNLHDRAGDPFAAAAAWRQATAANPAFAEAHANLGGALAQLGQAPEAEAALRRALEINPRLSIARERLGELCLAAGRLPEAEALLREATAQDPRAATALNALGLALRGLGRLPDALVAFRSAIAARPGLVEAQANLAALLAFLGDSAAAGAAADRALALAPGDDRVQMAAAVAAAARGDAAAAAAASREVVRLRPFVHVPAMGAPQATVLVLQALNGGHFRPAPAGALLPAGHGNAVEHLDRARFARIDLFVDALEEDPGLLQRLPRCDVILNAMADPQRLGRGLALAGSLPGMLGLPVVNAPADVARAAPDRLASLLEGIEGLAVARRARAAPAQDGAAAVLEAMAGAGLGFPVLARPDGAAARMLRGRDDLAALPANTAVTLVEPLPFADADGRWRKARLFSLGGRLLPEHLAAGSDATAAFGDGRDFQRAHPEEASREAEFLERFERHLGLARLAAAGEAAERLGLDILGMDVALLPQDRLLLIAAHPGLRAAPPGPGQPAGRISAAICDLVLKRAGR